MPAAAVQSEKSLASVELVPRVRAPNAKVAQLDEPGESVPEIVTGLVTEPEPARVAPD